MVAAVELIAVARVCQRSVSQQRKRQEWECVSATVTVDEGAQWSMTGDAVWQSNRESNAQLGAVAPRNHCAAKKEPVK